MTLVLFYLHGKSTRGCYKPLHLGGTPSSCSMMLINNKTYCPWSFITQLDATFTSYQTTETRTRDCLLELYNTTWCCVHNILLIGAWYHNSLQYLQYTYAYKWNQNTCTNTTTQPTNEEGYIARIWSTISHVASLDPKWFQCTLTCSITRFRSMSFFRCKMHWGYSWSSLWFHL